MANIKHVKINNNCDVGKVQHNHVKVPFFTLPLPPFMSTTFYPFLFVKKR